MKIQYPKGMQDILPSQIGMWQALESLCRDISARYGYKEIRTPILEKTELFVRGVGEGTDIVGKEMYSFVDQGNEALTMRPELTAGVARAVLQHSLMELSGTQRLWYYGPLFRHERPQAGRYRQFYQYGVELLGSPYPESDVEVIQLAYDLLCGLGLTEFSLKINTLGNAHSRQAYRDALTAYLTPLSDKLSEESRKRLAKNPLRILDSKDAGDKELLRDVPRFGDFLDEESRSYFDAVQQLLAALGISFFISDKLVRGLDYYSHTVFEFSTTKLGAQDALCGGGRYDGLFTQLGSHKPVPGVGFAAGVERLLLLLAEEQLSITQEHLPDFYLISLGDEARVVVQKLARELRKAGTVVLTDLRRRALKAQMKEADKLQARTVVIVGEEECNAGIVRVRNMATGEQSECPVETAASHLLSL